MKKSLPLLLFMLVFVTACQKPQPAPVDLESEKDAINDMMDNFEATTKTDSLAMFLTADALLTGTAPSELWNKDEMLEMWQEYFSGTVPEHKYIGERTLKVAADGNSATVIEEYIMPALSPVLPARNTLHLVKNDGSWMIDFVSMAFIPKNEDVPIIDEALKVND
jgi:hypothetical protein